MYVHIQLEKGIFKTWPASNWRGGRTAWYKHWGRVQNYVLIIRECCTFRVECVSPTSAGVTVQMIQVLAFPPRDDCSILVSLDSLNGMWALDT